MLMDVLHAEAGAAGVASRRLHWHEWIHGVHRRLHELRTASAASTDEKLRVLALEETADVLCLDEMAVHDVADALLLREIFSTMLNNGVVVVATSNRPPEELYAQGLNRHLFLPFVRLLARRVDHVRLEAVDRRRTGARDAELFVPTGGDAAPALAALGVSGGFAPETVAIAYCWPSGRFSDEPRRRRGRDVDIPRASHLVPASPLAGTGAR